MLPASVRATSPHPAVSGSYQFIDSLAIRDILSAANFELIDAKAKAARTEEKRNYGKHMMRFRPRGVVAEVGGGVPEIVVTNSHDRSAGFSMFGGFYRFVCENGAVIGDDIFALKTLHVGAAKNIVSEALEHMTQVIFPDITSKVNQWLEIQLSEAQKIRLAVKALELRFDNMMAPFGPERLLEVRRLADRNDDLWTTFNVLQENVIKGGIEHGRRRIRPIGAIDKDIRINRGLWKAAEELAAELT